MHGEIEVFDVIRIRCMDDPRHTSHNSGGFGFFGALRQEYFGSPSFFLLGHGLSKFVSFFHTLEAPARPARARGPDALSH